MGKVSEKPAESDHASNNPVPNPDALLQLKLAFEAEISFKDTMEAVEAKLCKMQKILDWGNLMGLEEFLRPKKADAEAFTTGQELGNRSPPDPCISKKNGNFKIACKENIVALPPASSPDKAAILLFTVYFILNLSYPYTFLQILGLLQRVFLKAKGQNMVRQVKPSFLLPFQDASTSSSPERASRHPGITPEIIDVMQEMSLVCASHARLVSKKKKKKKKEPEEEEEEEAKYVDIQEETMPIIRASAFADRSEGKDADPPDPENLKEKPPDNHDEAMDTSQTRKRPAPCSDVGRVTASDAVEQASSSDGQSLGGGGTRRLCQRPQEITAKKCRGRKAADSPVAKGNEKNFR
ncbi:hypothetical protein HPB50_023398 [Hyalomma asiaticum]|uniref:Uncharacterized protein n=1 Tax=Hyalomma asiaticum TaxID=266040 RepID=A0ACB7S3A1_HYAAI|nr:hypothetical protein HPB50_023398 [Hyalomma asiaticum]